jgi:hypothetical protein
VLGYVVAAVALAVLLPSGLNLPNSGPPTVAEYAPVPGSGQHSGDEGQLGSANGNGLGAGTGTGTGAASQGSQTSTSQSVGTGRQLQPPNNYQCVKQNDGIWHQTEDPLSPPCITYGPADNGGPTGAPGVSRSEIRVLVQLQPNTATGPASNAYVDCNSAITSSDSVDDAECKAYTKFFNQRYFTYHRTVHVYGVHRLAPADAIERFHPFADVNGLGAVYSDYAAHGVLAVGFGGNSRAAYQQYAPYILSFWPDFEDAAALAASYVCRRLGHAKADLTVDPTLQKPRKYGYWADSDPPSNYDRALVAALNSTCGIDVSHDYVYGAAHPEFAAKLKGDGVTTVIAAFNFGTGASVTGIAAKAGYFPEWVIPGSDKFQSMLSNSHAHEEDPTEWRQAIGIGFDYRRDAEHAQYWYRAYRSVCPSCPEPTASDGSYAPEIYDALQLFFTGVQLGGPRLTAQTIDQGLHAIPPTSSPTPYRPAGYLVPGNYSFIKDAVGLWWDPQGRTPDASAPGCYRLVGGGRRYRAGEWPQGEAGIRGSSRDPCQGDTIPGT